MLTTDIKGLQWYINNKPPAQNIGEGLTTTRNFPILYRQITKCGSTYMHRVLNHLDGLHPKLGRDLRALDFTDQMVHDCPDKFIILRDPKDRFMSLYFDKVLGPTNRVGQELIDAGNININPSTDITEHRKNCVEMLTIIRATLDPNTDLIPNFHWRPQMFRLKEVSHFGFHAITLEGLIWQLPHILRSTVPDMAKALYDVPLQNVSNKLIDPKQIMNDEIEQMLIDIYTKDFEIFEEVSQFWDREKQRLNADGTA